MREYIVNTLEGWARIAYSWITDKDEVLGEIIYTLHLFGFYTLMVLIVVSHTFYPMFWFQAFVFGFLSLVWLQHMCLKTCVLTSLERRLLGRQHPLMIDGLLDMFGIPVQKETRMGVTLMLSTVGVLFLGLELTSRSVMYARSLMGVSVWL
jgi:hypothetical protein